MRIIGGYLKGRPINVPASYQARPTTDFAKEGLFNTLENEFDFESLSVLDLFSGTGSISYEFASRGCGDIVAVEMNSVNAAFIKKSADTLGVKMNIVRHNVFDFLQICKKNFDIVFADPPYAIEGLADLPQKVLSSSAAIPGTLFILEHPKEYSFANHPSFIKERKYGNVHFSYFKK